MAGNTGAPLNLYLPGGGSTGTWTPDEVADIDPLNQNFQDINANALLVDSFRVAQLGRNQQFTGLAGSIGLVTGHKRGDTYQETDGNFVTWKYDGANWVNWESGAALIRPTSIANVGGAATHNPDGTVAFSGACTAISLNGVFTSRFREYEISFDVLKSSPGSTLFRLRAAGADNTAAQYFYRRVGSSGAGVTDPLVSSDTRFDTGFLSASVSAGSFRLRNAQDAATTRLICGSSMDSHAGTIAQVVNIVGEHRVSTAYDGFTCLVAAGTFAGTIRVVGFV